MSGTNPELEQALWGSEVLHADKGAASALNIWCFISCHCKLCSSDKQTQMTEAKLILFIPPCRVTWSAENNSQIYFSHPFFQSFYPTVIFFFSPFFRVSFKKSETSIRKEKDKVLSNDLFSSSTYLVFVLCFLNFHTKFLHRLLLLFNVWIKKEQQNHSVGYMASFLDQVRLVGGSGQSKLKHAVLDPDKSWPHSRTHVKLIRWS